MPIYEYTCRACGQDSEISHKMADPPARKCPVCGKLKLTKLVSASAFRLKGGGWYETDFKSGDKKNLEGDKAEKTPEEKPADKKDAKEPVKDVKEAKSDKGEKKAEKPVEKKPAETAKPAAAKTSTEKK